MRVRTYTLDGAPAAEAELTRDESAQLRLDGDLVVAVSIWGSRVALTLTRRLVVIDTLAFGRLVPHVRSTDPGAGLHGGVEAGTGPA